MDAFASEKTDVVFDVDLDEKVKEIIRNGIADIIKRFEVTPHEFLISEVDEIWENPPPEAFDICARGAAVLALGLSSKTTNLPFDIVT